MLLIPLLLAPHLACGTPPCVDVRLERKAREVVVTIGPFRVQPSLPMDHDMGGMMMDMHEHESLVGQFAWPVTAPYHGVRLAVVDSAGGALPRRLLHHTYMVNFDRRQLVYPIIERPFSFGEETEDIGLPASLGMPMGAGQHMGIVIMWDNLTGHEVEGAYVRYTFTLNRRRQWPRPVGIMPIFIDANMNAGVHDTFSVAPGGRQIATRFTVPISGRLLAASGHLHDHAVSLQIQDSATGRMLVTVHAIRDDTGHTLRVSREILALWHGGPHLVANRPYRLILTYDNPTQDTLTGVMGMLGGLFVPDHPREWPKLDPTDPVTRADIDGLLGSRRVAMEEERRP